MSKSSMLRTRRRDVNVKPNRRLDRKSSRGMIYENEELRLRTININAEIERGQSDIKKLRRENEQLRKEIWCLRDEYDKLDKLLKEKDDETSCSSDTESSSSCSESEDNETTQNLENVQKTAFNTFRNEFDHLSVVTEENSAENSDKNSTGANGGEKWEAIQPDQSYPADISQSPKQKTPKHFFSPIRKETYEPPIGWTDESFLPNWGKCESYLNYNHNFDVAIPDQPKPESSLQPCEKTSTDLLVGDHVKYHSNSTNSFVNGGNLEELLQDIESISKDILQISTEKNTQESEKPYKSELNVVLLPKPMPLLGFDKYFKTSLDNIPPPPDTLDTIPNNFLVPFLDDPYIPRPLTPIPVQNHHNPFCFQDAIRDETKEDAYQKKEPPTQGFDNFAFKSDLQSSDERTEKSNQTNESIETGKMIDKKDDKKNNRTRKVSIYFKGKKDKPNRSTDKAGKSDTDEGNKSDKSPVVEKKLNKVELMKMSSVDSKTSTSDEKKSDEKTEGKNGERKHRKSSSTSPERKHHGKADDGKRVHKKRHKKRSMDRNRERSFSVCTDRSNILDNKYRSDDYTNSERERTNSLSSCDTMKSRKLSAVPTFQMTGKIPWFGCWGNGCI